MCPIFCNFAAAKPKAANLRFGGRKEPEMAVVR
jgi:hypothetical protein